MRPVAGWLWLWLAVAGWLAGCGCGWLWLWLAGCGWLAVAGWLACKLKNQI